MSTSTMNAPPGRRHWLTGPVYRILNLLKSLLSQREPDMPKEPVRLIVRQIDESTYRIVDGEGRPVVPELRAGMKISWQTEKQRVYFQFPELSLFEELERNKTWTVEIPEPEGTLELTVSERAKAGTYVYSAFCVIQSDGRCMNLAYAEGGSPPRMRILT